MSDSTTRDSATRGVGEPMQPPLFAPGGNNKNPEDALTDQILSNKEVVAGILAAPLYSIIKRNLGFLAVFFPEQQIKMMIMMSLPPRAERETS